MNRIDMEGVPEELRPPKSWPLVVFTLAALVLALAALYLAWGASGTATETRETTKATAGRVDVTYQRRCDAARVRIRVQPETKVERAMRDLALRTFTEDCPKG